MIKHQKFTAIFYNIFSKSTYNVIFRVINSNQKQTNHEETTFFIYSIPGISFLSNENDFGNC